MAKRIHCSAPAVIGGVLLLGSMALLGSCDREPPPPVVAPDPSVELDPLLAELIERHRRAAEEEPGRGDLHGTLGMVYEANRMWGPARRCYENAALLAPSDPVWVLHAALATGKLGDISGTRARLRRIAGRHRNHAPAQHAWGSMLLKSGALEEAEEALERALTLAPREPVAQATLADCLLRRGQYRRAIPLLEDAVRARPDHGQASYLLGLAYRAAGRTEEARARLQAGAGSSTLPMPDRITRSLPQYRVGLSLQIERALSLLGGGNARAAAQLLESALAHRPEQVSLLNNLAMAYMELKRHDEALETLDRALAEEPRNFRTYINRCEVLLAMGRADDASLDAAVAVELAPGVAQAHFAVARSFIGAGRYAEAREPLERAVGLDPRKPHFLPVLGEVQMRLGRLEEARRTFLKAAEAFPDELPIHVNLSLLHSRLGSPGEARASLGRARRIDPDHPRVKRLAQILGEGGKP